MSIVLNSRLDTEIGGASNRLIEEMSKVEAYAANVYQSETRGRAAVCSNKPQSELETESKVKITKYLLYKYKYDRKSPTDPEQPSYQFVRYRNTKVANDIVFLQFTTYSQVILNNWVIDKKVTILTFNCYTAEW